MNIRAEAAKVLFQVVDGGKSLSSELPKAQEKIPARDHGLLQEMCYGVLRHLSTLEVITHQLMDKPLRGKKRVFHHLILVGIYQLKYMRIPDHAALSETVNATKNLKEIRFKGLVNAILRNYLRNKDALDHQAEQDEKGKYNHPDWLLNMLKKAYPSQWQSIAEQNNQKPPMWLRVNHKYSSAQKYQQLLLDQGITSHLCDIAPEALLLSKPQDVTKLPHFSEGWVSVQDGAAQLAYHYLQPQVGDKILDCCAAPGGKTAHVLEKVDCDMTAIDSDKHRLLRVNENLTRLNLTANVLCADATTDTWWDKEQYDRILLDAPCSATGVIRRHPDIKWLRKADDISQLVELQAKIMDTTWKMLKPGGRMVYATCSILPRENNKQIDAFLQRTDDAIHLPIVESQLGKQITPNEHKMDGFFYAILEKAS